ncbi:hypothetical protein C4580_00715 [Candidatus Woesearchaeota archaeon]|nr:MAG: hypothetical protein C4580_00715 [Candidatus Woesearchaeota archaeon]
MTYTTDSGTYRRHTFKMSLTEAVRAHANHEQDIAAKHYRAAIGSAQNGHAYLSQLIFFLQSQAESTSNWPLSSALNHAHKGGYTEELDALSALLEDPSVKKVYDEYLGAIRNSQRPVTRRLPRSSFVDPTPTGRTARPF